MLEQIKQELEKVPSRQAKINTLRELMQTAILYQLSNTDAASDLAFMGGTALRFFYDLPRYSEDLDFEIVQKRKKSFSLSSLQVQIQKSIQRFVPQVESTCNEKTNVQKGFLKFPGLLYELGLTDQPSLKLSIKLEVDTNPPQAGTYETYTIVKYGYIFPLRKRDLASLMAGKIHAVVARPYAKGRDYFDLAWYLSRRVEPNYDYLDKNLQIKSLDDLDAVLQDCVKKADLLSLQKDVEPLLENPQDRGLLTSLPQIISQYAEMQKMK